MPNDIIIPHLNDYHAGEDDTRPIIDPQLEYDADRIGMIHSRKHRSPTVYLEGYGRTNFGVSAYKINRKYLTGKNMMIAGLSAAGLVAWKLRKGMASTLDTAVTYALLMKEAYRS